MSIERHTDDYSATEEPFGIYQTRQLAKDMRRQRREHDRIERNRRSEFMVSARRKMEAQGWRF